MWLPYVWPLPRRNLHSAGPGSDLSIRSALLRKNQFRGGGSESLLRSLEMVAFKVTEGCVSFDKRGLWEWHRNVKLGKYFNTIQENDQLLQSSCGEGTIG